MEYLHHNKIIHRNLKPSNIFLDSNYHPFLYNFNMAIFIEEPLHYYIKAKTFEYIAPELINDYKNNQCSFKLDVYSFGIILCDLLIGKIETKEYEYENEEKYIESLNKGDHPGLPKDFSKFFPNEMSEWKELIIQYSNLEPDNRPNFSTICNILETIANKSKIINKYDFQTYRTETFGKLKRYNMISYSTKYNLPKFPALD